MFSYAKSHVHSSGITGLHKQDFSDSQCGSIEGIFKFLRAELGLRISSRFHCCRLKIVCQLFKPTFQTGSCCFWERDLIASFRPQVLSVRKHRLLSLLNWDFDLARRSTGRSIFMQCVFSHLKRNMCPTFATFDLFWIQNRSKHFLPISCIKRC